MTTGFALQKMEKSMAKKGQAIYIKIIMKPLKKNLTRKIVQTLGISICTYGDVH